MIVKEENPESVFINAVRVIKTVSFLPDVCNSGFEKTHATETVDVGCSFDGCMLTAACTSALLLMNGKRVVIEIQTSTYTRACT